MKRPRTIRIKVLLVGDHTLVVEGIKSCLNAHRQFEVVGEASHANEVIRKARDSKPDVVVNNLAIKRLGTPQDCANVCDFFVNPASDNITGQVIYLGGVS